MTKKARSGTGQRKWSILAGGFVLAALFLLFLWNLRIDRVTVNGGDFYTEQELINYIFEKPVERNFLYAWLNDRFGSQKPIPFISGYTMEFVGTGEVHVTVYEKNVIGYVDYMGSHMYFDKDGTVVESSSEVWEGIPLITGLDFRYIVLYKPLPVENETAFMEILNLTQLIRKYDIPVEKIYFDPAFHATLYIDEIQVLLGDKTSMEEKIAELTGMLKALSGRSGTLHLERYDRTAMNPAYSFIENVDEPATVPLGDGPTDPAQEEGSAENGEEEGHNPEEQG
ncbi:MAG: cell division protein FtsQ [Lachnospiraceae bacterium]|jgi:cell division protein FtsQ|nr:cell division protein FtsQ [Lachnospiraceae bacterium]